MAKKSSESISTPSEQSPLVGSNPQQATSQSQPSLNDDEISTSKPTRFLFVELTQDVPTDERWKIRLLMSLIIAYIFLLFFNVILSVIGAVLAGNTPDASAFIKNMSISTAALSPFWLIVLPLTAFFWWFCPVYISYRTDNTPTVTRTVLRFWWSGFTLSGFLVSLIILVIQCFAWLVIPIGAPGVNVGIISGVYMMIYVNVPLGAIWIAVSVLWIPLFIGGVVAIVSILHYVNNNIVVRSSTKGTPVESLFK